MIHRIYSSLETFKELHLSSRLQVLLAIRSRHATDRQSRNGVGKSSLVDLIRFLLGGNVDGDSIFRSEALIRYRFGMTFDLGGQRVTVERSGLKPSRIVLREGAFTEALKYRRDKTLEEETISVSEWKSLLASHMFGIDDSSSNNDEEGNNPHLEGWVPSASSLLAYFVRREAAGAFATAVKQNAKQAPFDYQTGITFLLGLDWSIPAQWRPVREQERQLETLRKGLRDGALGSYIGTVSELRTLLAVAEERLAQIEDQIASADVLPQFQASEDEGVLIASRLRELSDENVLDRQLAAEMRSSLEHEIEPAIEDLERLYGEAGVVLQTAVLRSFADVAEFHRSVIRNRRSYLSMQLDEAETRIAIRQREIQQLTSRQAQVIELLRSRTAGAQLSALQTEVIRQQLTVEDLRKRFEIADQIEGGRNESEIARNRLSLRLQQDYREQDGNVNEAIRLFQRFSSQLYDDAGSLSISATTNGPEFNLTIAKNKSNGINKMQIFCFDLTLATLAARSGRGPGFLIHDSHLFDGVDERQIFSALRVGQTTAEAEGFQYIVTLNSDDVPVEFSLHQKDQVKGIQPDLARDSFWSSVLPVRLTDETNAGGLFGIPF